MTCPKCQSENIKKKYECKECKRQFVENPKWRKVSDETKELINKLLLEKIPLSGIARVAGVSEQWLQDYVNKIYEDVPKEVEVPTKEKGKITITSNDNLP